MYQLSEIHTGGGTFTGAILQNFFPLLISSRTSKRTEIISTIGHHNSRNNWVLDYTLTPAGRYKVGKRNSRWRARDAGIAHLYPPFTDYWEDTRLLDHPLASTFILFQGGEALGLADLTQGRDGFARINDPEKILGTELIGLAELCYLHGENALIPAYSKFFQVISILNHAIRGGEGDLCIQGQAGTGRETTFADQVDDYLNRNYWKPLTLRSIAERFNVSPSTLSHRYRHESGGTPLNTLLHIRIEFSKPLIIKGMLLKEVARMTGFYDEYHLSKMFKKITGESPRAFLARF